MIDMDIKDYLIDSLHGKRVARWNKNEINIYVMPYTFSDKDFVEHIYFALVQKSLKMWEEASGGRFKFNLVDNFWQADIKIMYQKVRRDAWGKCYYNDLVNGSFRKLNLLIGVSNGDLSTTLNENQIFEIITHEIGHALGLGHVENKNSVMHPKNSARAKLSIEDIVTLQLIWSLPSGAYYDDIKHKIPELKNEIISKLKGNKAPLVFSKKDFLIELSELAQMNKQNLITQNFVYFKRRDIKYVPILLA